MTVTFSPPSLVAADAVHRSRAASQNEAAAKFAKGQLLDALNGSSDIQRILLKAAAGAGKSFLLRGLVRDAITQPQCLRVAVTAFQNRQLWPLAASLGDEIGKDRVWLWASKRVFNDVPDGVKSSATVVDSVKAIPQDVPVVLTTTHMLGMTRQHVRNHFGSSFHGDFRFDALFVDEAWQLPHHLFDKITYAAPIHVGVGDVGQLPTAGNRREPMARGPGLQPLSRLADGVRRRRDEDLGDGVACRLASDWRATRSLACVLPRVGVAQLRCRTRRPCDPPGAPVRHRKGRVGVRRNWCSDAARGRRASIRRSVRRRPPAGRVRRTPARRTVLGWVHAVSGGLQQRRNPERQDEGGSSWLEPRRPARRHPRDPQPVRRRRQ